MDIKLDINGDLDVTTYDFVIVRSLDYMQQKLLLSLRLILGEWFLDVTQGIPYFEEIFKKDFSPETIEAVLKAAILNVAGVDEITAFDLNITGPRELTVTFSVSTDYGELALSEVL